MRLRQDRARTQQQNGIGKVQIVITFVLSMIVLCNLVTNASLVQNTSHANIDYVAMLNELIKKGSDESLNADPFYRRAFALYVRPPVEVSANEVGRWATELTNSQRSVLRKWIDANSDALVQLRLGTEKPCYWFHYEGLSILQIDEVSHMRRMRELFFALMLRTKFEAAEGDVKAAIDDLLICYRFGSDMKKRLLLGEQLSARASLAYTWDAGLQILDRVKIDNTSLRFLQEQITSHSKDEDFLVDLRGDELAALDMIWWTNRRWPATAQAERRKEEISWQASDFLETNVSPEQVDSLMYKHTKDELERLAKKGYAYYNTIIAKTPFEWHQQQIDWDKAKKELVDGNLLLLVLVRAIPHISEAGFRCRVERDALITTLALLRYRNDTGGLPDDLQTLTARGYMPQLPMDPYSDKPLVYKRTENNFTLYSIGVDFQDNGGRHSSKWGLEAQGGDFIFWPVQNE
jgi:hypothetical protein